MNKKRNIIIGILALAITMMVGYALFSDTITINGTATAKGDFSITTTCTPGFSSEIGVSKTQYISDTNNFYQNMREIAGVTTVPSSYKVIDSENESGYKNDACTVNGNNVSFNVDLSYPGAYRLFVVKFTNTGTIPAKLDDSTLLSGSVSIYEKNVQGSSYQSNDASGTDAYYKDGFNVMSFDNLNIDLQAEQLSVKTNPILEPGESSYAVIRMAWAGDDTGNKRDLTFTFEHQFEFNQITNN